MAANRWMERFDIEPGTDVRVRSRFDGAWVGGYRISDVENSDRPGARRYRVARVADGDELPAVFDPNEVVPADQGPPGQFWPGLPS